MPPSPTIFEICEVEFMVYERGLKWYEMDPEKCHRKRSDYGIYIPANVVDLARDRRREGLEPGLAPVLEFPKSATMPKRDLKWWERLLSRARKGFQG